MALVACGWRHSVAVSSSGGLYTYGWSKYGQLGHGDFQDHLVPHKVEALKDSSISLVLMQNTETFYNTVTYSPLIRTWDSKDERIQVVS
jgi:alpha-tubulin suppressor-like RCC1 family protein